MEEINKSKRNNPIKEQNDKGKRVCCVKNCRKQLKDEEGVVIDDKLYCPRCATIIMRSMFSL